MRVIFALGGELGLMAVDSGLMIGTVDAGNAVERVILRGGCANEAAMEEQDPLTDAPSACAAEPGWRGR